MLTTIPFSGFYYSLWSDLIDREEEYFAENFANDRQAEDDIPPALRLTESEVCEILFDCMDYRAAHEEIARDYATAWIEAAEEALGFKLGATFESMSSPREYNFATDRIFCEIPLARVARLFVKSRQAGHGDLRKAIAERFTSRDGFLSFYSNDRADWLEKPLADWDHNEIGTLLAAVVGEIEELDIFYRLADYSYQYLDSHLDWAKFDAAVEAKREEKREEAGDTIAPAPYRCRETPDLFAEPRT